MADKPTTAPKKPGPQVEHDTHEERLARIEAALLTGDPTAMSAMMVEAGRPK